MPADDLPPDVDPGTDPEELERLMLLGAKDPALHGPMFRALLGARVWCFIPPHPEMVDHERAANDPLTWVCFRDEQGLFAPVFASEKAAERRAEKMLPRPPMMLEIPARVLLAHIQAAGNTVLLIASNGAQIRIPPEALASLLKGSFTEAGTGEMETRQMTLHPIAAEDFPREWETAIREFCTQRQGAMAVYAFHPRGGEHGRVQWTETHLILRLRDDAGHFFDDFEMMMERLVPEGCKLRVGAVVPEDAASMEFLARCTPVWPVLPGA